MIRWLPLLAAGCTFADGEAFTVLGGGQLEGAVATTSTSESGAAVVLDEATVVIAEVALQALSGGGTFDPADPPPGYGLCHNGHCHADDGSLPTYAEIEAELAGDAATWDDVARLDGATVDLLDGEVVLGTPRPRALSPGTIGRAVLRVSALTVAGTLDGVPFSTSGPVDVEVPASIGLEVGRGAPARVTLALTWVELPLDGLIATGEPEPADLARATVDATWEER